MSSVRQQAWPRRRWWLWPCAWAVFWVGLWLATCCISLRYNLGNFGRIGVGFGAFRAATPMDENEARWVQGTGPDDAGTWTMDRTWPWFEREWFGRDRHPAGARGRLIGEWDYPLNPRLIGLPRYTHEPPYPRCFDAPFWLLALPALVPIAVRIRQCRRRRRGSCPLCAYNRRGAFEGPCPECGTVVANPVTHTCT